MEDWLEGRGLGDKHLRRHWVKNQGWQVYADRHQTHDECFTLLSPLSVKIPDTFELQGYLHFFRMMYYQHILREVEYRRYIDPQLLYITALLNPKIVIIPRGISHETNFTDREQIRRRIEWEVAGCGKTVFITGHEEIKFERQYLSRHYPEHDFQVGKDIIDLGMEGYQFRGVGISKIPGNFQSLMETGIVGHIKEFESQKKYRTRQPLTKIRQGFPKNVWAAVELHTRIGTLFALFGILIAVGNLSFVVECRHRIVSLVWNGMCQIRAIYDKICESMRQFRSRMKVTFNLFNPELQVQGQVRIISTTLPSKSVVYVESVGRLQRL